LNDDCRSGRAEFIAARSHVFYAILKYARPVELRRGHRIDPAQP
jgi:hypothetical protein